MNHPTQTWTAPALAALALPVLGCAASPPDPRVSDDERWELADERLVGLPDEWHQWVGFDDFEPISHVDWPEYFDQFPNTTTTHRMWGPGDGCLYELTQYDGDVTRRWFVLVQPDPEDSSLQRDVDRFTVTATEKLEVDVPQLHRAAHVTVHSVGDGEAKTRSCPLPILAAGFGHMTSLDPQLKQYLTEQVDSENWSDSETLVAYSAAVFRSVASLVMLFEGIREHQELGPILEDVVRKPSLLQILVSGGVRLVLNVGSNTERAEWTSSSGETVECARIPATVIANGQDALALEVLATEAVSPVHLTGGLLGFRAWHPTDGQQAVELRLIGARTNRE